MTLLFGELAQVKSAHTVLTIANCFPTDFKRHCIDLHHNYILQAFVLKTVICTSYFFINNFPSFLKAKIAFEIGLLLGLGSLGFGLNTICCSLPLEHSAQHLPDLVLGNPCLCLQHNI